MSYGDTVLGVECALPLALLKRSRVRAFLGRLAAVLKRWG
jgi:hypothetical protein